MVGDAYESLMQWNCIFDDDELKEPCKLIQIDKHYTDSEIESFREYLSKAEEYDKMIRDVNEPMVFRTDELEVIWTKRHRSGNIPEDIINWEWKKKYIADLIDLGLVG